MTRVAGFEDWSRTVQQPLMWLGEADPLGEMKSARALDPTAEELRRLLGALRKHFAAEEFFTVADCEQLAEETSHDGMGRPIYKNQDLRGEMVSHGKIDTITFGLKLRRHRDRVLNGWSVRIASGKRKPKDPNSYYLEGPAEPTPPDGGIPFMITAAMKERLRACGYNDDDIRNMSPQQAHEILGPDDSGGQAEARPPAEKTEAM